MSRTAGILSIACALLAALPATAAAGVEVDPNIVCPDMFVVAPSGIAPPGTDKNANGIACVKPVDGFILWRDDLLKTD